MTPTAADLPEFPADAIVGSCGEIARAYGKGSEIPESFLFVDALTLLGCTWSDKLSVDNGTNTEPRLYTINLGGIGDTKKSSASNKVIDFFTKTRGTDPDLRNSIIRGVGSAEGLARRLESGKPCLLALDELSAFIGKTQIKASVLLPMVCSLYESHDFENAVKDGDDSVSVEDARLSMIACCTTGTYSRVFTQEAMSIGLPNRLFVVAANPKEKEAWPETPSETELNCIYDRIYGQSQAFRGGAVKLKITRDAKTEWTSWYMDLPRGEHSKRLDGIGFRLMPLIALTTDKAEIDLKTVQTVIKILNYELEVRKATDPVDCDNKMAELEVRIRRALSRSPMTKGQLKHAIHADRAGVWFFDRAFDNLSLTSGEITWRKDASGNVLWYLVKEPVEKIKIVR